MTSRHFRFQAVRAGLAFERWDILAKAEGADRIPMVQMRPMLQALMADRFLLKVHSETREMPVYALMVEKNGSKLTLNSGAERQFRPNRLCSAWSRSGKYGCSGGFIVKAAKGTGGD